MLQVKNVTGGGLISAQAYKRLSDTAQAEIRDGLRCRGCDADAYFIRRSVRGHSETFGARHRKPDCPHASAQSDEQAKRSLPEAERKEAAASEFSLRSAEWGKKAAVTHVEHSDDAPGLDPHHRARRYLRDGSGQVSTPSHNLGVLLALLDGEPGFADSNKTMVLPDATRAVVRDFCIHADDVTVNLRWKKRIYWGTIRFAGKDGDKYWLNTGSVGSGTPTVVLSTRQMDQLVAAKGIDELEDLQGASFIVYAQLGMAEKTGRFFIFVKEMNWFDIVLA